MTATPPTASRPRWLIPLLATAAALLVGILIGITMIVTLSAAGRGSANPVAVASSTSSPSPSPGPADQWGARACDSSKRIADRLVGEPLTISDANIVAEQGQKSTDSDIRFQASMLQDRADIAQASIGASDQGVNLIQLTTAFLQLRTACIRAGYPT